MRSRLLAFVLVGGCTLEVDVGDSFRRSDAGPCLAWPVRSLSVAEHHACAVTVDGRALCWGEGSAGELGDGSTTTRLRPVPVLTNDRFTEIRTGVVNTCALRTDGRLLCWGSNFTGLLADGTSQGASTPVPTLADTARFDLYDGAVLALTTGGALYGWGENRYGMLGLGAAQVGAVLRDETPVPGGARAVATGSGHACVLDDLGHARCAGTNVNGQLGLAGPDRDAFVAIDDALSFSAIDAGHDRTCAIDAAGALFCWGRNVPTLNPAGGDVVPIPWQVGMASDHTAVSVGFDHVCVLRTGGRLFCWGGGDRLASAVGGGSPTPVEILPGTAFSAVSAGRDVTCAIRAGDGAALCFGRGAEGQLGRGSRDDGRPDAVCAP